MKIRSVFVSNSSSSSFIIQIDKLTHHQREKINELDVNETEWNIIDHYPIIFGHTHMDNFCMEDWLEDNGFPLAEFSFWSSNDPPASNVYRDSFKECIDNPCEYCKNDSLEVRKLMADT